MVTAYTTRASPARTWAGLGILTPAVLLLAIDGTVLALAIPALTADLDPSSTQVLWIGDIYSFALAGLLVVTGNLADRIGRKRLLMIGSVGFGLSSLAAAFVPTPELLIAARAVLGYPRQRCDCRHALRATGATVCAIGAAAHRRTGRTRDLSQRRPTRHRGPVLGGSGSRRQAEGRP